MNKTVHVMVDIETYSVRPFAAIASIGAASFDPHTREVFSSFYVNLDPKSCGEIGLDFQDSVLEWWDRQPKEVQDAVKEDQKPVTEALQSFKDWHLRQGSIAVWSHGATFDIPILSNAFDLCGSAAPWKFISARDTRTLFDVSGFDVNTVKRGTAHHAAADVLYQIRCVQGAYAKLKVERGE